MAHRAVEMAQAAVIGFGEERARDVALWQRAHQELVRLAATRAELDYEEGRWMLRAERAGAHLRLGYASFREYLERLFGYSARLVQEKVVEMAACDGQDVGHVERAHVGTSSEDARPTRAKQTIPPALRRQVMRRDGGRCQVPGCRHAVFTDVHHLRARSEGGENTLENLVTLCSAHHRAIHRGELVVGGTPSERLVFRHADGTQYGASLSSMSAELRAKAQRALTRMGYGETEATRALAQVPAHPDESLERLVRLALRELA